MSIYRSAYENYYKNINSAVKGKFNVGKKGNKSSSSKHGIDIKYNNTIRNNLIKRIIKELTGATILLLFFVGLKYIPSTQVKEMHIKYKERLEQNFNYNESIDSFNKIQIGNIQVKDLKIGNFTTEDLRLDNLKTNTANFIEYLKKEIIIYEISLGTLNGSWFSNIIGVINEKVVYSIDCGVINIDVAWRF